MKRRGSGDGWSASAEVDRLGRAQEQWLVKPELALFAVADGGDELDAPQVTSAMEHLARHLSAAPLEIARHRTAPAALNRSIPSLSRARVSMAWAVAGPQGVVFGWLGLCRVGRLRSGVLTWLTLDHSLAEQMVAEEQLTRVEAVDHPCRKVLARSFGKGEVGDADVMALDPQPGDQLLLCTDGLYDALSDEEIALIAAGGAEALVAAAERSARAAVLVTLC